MGISARSAVQKTNRERVICGLAEQRLAERGLNTPRQHLDDWACQPDFF